MTVRKAELSPATGKPPHRWPPAWIAGFYLLGAAAAASFFLDAPVLAAIRGGLWPSNMDGPVWPVLLGSFFGQYGDWPQLMVVGAFGLVFARWKRRPQLFRLLLLMMLCSTLAGAVVNGLRLTTGRARPSNPEAQGWVGPVHEGRLTLGRHAFNAFPSGHTATAFGFFGPLLFTPWWRLGCLFLPIPAAIGLARILTLSHHPSDVLCSAWIALFVSAVITRRWGRSMGRGAQT